MPRYVFRFEGREHESKAADFDTVDQARNEAVRYLGSYLAEHPGFANEGHWRVNVENAFGQNLLHVIVATVTAKPRSGALQESEERWPVRLCIHAPRWTGGAIFPDKVNRVFAQPDPSKLREFADDIRDGKFVLPISLRMELSRAAAAHALLEQGGGGKIVLTI